MVLVPAIIRDPTKAINIGEWSVIDVLLYSKTSLNRSIWKNERSVDVDGWRGFIVCELCKYSIQNVECQVNKILMV